MRTRFWRKPNHVVAAGPKIAWEWLSGMFLVGISSSANIPPPYNAILAVLPNSWFFSPFFSTRCCASASPVPKRIAVVTLCVRSGREANFIWYLLISGQLACLLQSILLVLPPFHSIDLLLTYQRSILRGCSLVFKKLFASMLLKVSKNSGIDTDKTPSLCPW